VISWFLKNIGFFLLSCLCCCSFFYFSKCLADKLDPCRPHVESRLGALAGVCNLLREYSTSNDNRAHKFDFLDLT